MHKRKRTLTSMGEKQKNLEGIAGIIVIIAIVWLSVLYSRIWNLKNDNINLQDEIAGLERKKLEVEDDLSTAESNLEEVNNNIEEAKQNAWGTYQDMGDALDQLETVE